MENYDNTTKNNPFEIEDTEIDFEQKFFKLKEILDIAEKNGLNINELMLKLDISLLQRWEEPYKTKALDLLNGYFNLMGNYYKVHNMRKTEYEEEYPFIELIDDKDFEFYFYLHQQITVITDAGEVYKGVLSAVEDTCFKRQTDNEGEVTVTYFETNGIIGKPDRE